MINFKRIAMKFSYAKKFTSQKEMREFLDKE